MAMIFFNRIFNSHILFDRREPLFAHQLHDNSLFSQNGREDGLLSNALMTPPRSSTFLDTGLHKDVFGVISGTCEWTNTGG